MVVELLAKFVGFGGDVPPGIFLVYMGGRGRGWRLSGLCWPWAAWGSPCSSA